ncbi:hypothetical protein IFT69_14710 [Pseudomonas putida]|nr:hypothetical protein [Pseudomonas putida]
MKSLFAVDDLITPYPKNPVNPQSELFSSFLQILASRIAAWVGAMHFTEGGHPGHPKENRQ